MPTIVPIGKLSSGPWLKSASSTAPYCCCASVPNGPGQPRGRDRALGEQARHLRQNLRHLRDRVQLVPVRFEQRAGQHACDVVQGVDADLGVGLGEGRDGLVRRAWHHAQSLAPLLHLRRVGDHPHVDGLTRLRFPGGIVRVGRRELALDLSEDERDVAALDELRLAGLQVARPHSPPLIVLILTVSPCWAK